MWWKGHSITQMFQLIAISLAILTPGTLQAPTKANPLPTIPGAARSTFDDIKGSIELKVDGKDWCNGKAISDYKVALSAHCVYQNNSIIDSKRMTIRVFNKDGTYQTVAVRNVNLNPGYVKEGAIDLNYDHAYLEVDHKFKPDEIRPLSFEKQKVGETAIVETLGGNTNATWDEKKKGFIHSKPAFQNPQKLKSKVIGTQDKRVFMNADNSHTVLKGVSGSAVVDESGVNRGIMSAIEDDGQGKMIWNSYAPHDKEFHDSVFSQIKGRRKRV
jgi:hypothetical protein